MIMKIRLIMILGIAMILFSNCAEKTIDSPFNTAVVVANMETDLVKSSATDEGFFTWAKGDQIAIHTNLGMLVGTLNAGAGTASGSFEYSFVGDKPELTGYAVYPYNSGHKIASSNLTFVMPDSYDLGKTLANTNAAMLAKNSSGTNYNFTHLGGVFRFIIKNAPIGADKFTLSLGGKKINGEFSVAMNAEEPVIETAEGSDENNTTTLNFNALESSQDITLFVPVPVGEYTGITAKLYKGDKEIGSWGSATAVNNVSRKSLKLMAPITYSNVSGDIQNEIQVASAEQLKSALEQGGVIEIVDDIIGLTEILVISKDVVINGNGHTITSSAGRAINVSGATDVTIKNLTINASGERAINIIQNAQNVTIDNVTATAANYTVNVASSAPGAVVVINNSTLTGLNVVNVASAGAVVNVSGSTINCNDNDTTEGETYAALCLNKDATGGIITATDCTINVTEGSDSQKGRNDAYNGNVIIDGSEEGIKVNSAFIIKGDYYYGYETLADALANVKEDVATVELSRDVVLTEAITIPAGATVTLDLNNHDLTGSYTGADHYAMFTIPNGASMTVTGDGNVSAVTDVTADNRSLALFLNHGNLTLKSGTYNMENTGNSHTWIIATIVDNRTNSNSCATRLTIDGGTYSVSGKATNLFRNYPQQGGSATLIINGGLFKSNNGATTYIWNQESGSYLGELYFNGGTYETGVVYEDYNGQDDVHIALGVDIQGYSGNN